MTLERAEINTFIEDGFVRITEVFSGSVAQQCVEIMWPETGCSCNPASWTKPMVRLPGYDTEPFRTPTVEPAVPLELDRVDGIYSPVEKAIRLGLGGTPTLSGTARRSR